MYAIVSTDNTGVVGFYTLRPVLQAPCLRDIYDRRHYREQWLAQPVWVAQPWNKRGDSTMSLNDHFGAGKYAERGEGANEGATDVCSPRGRVWGLHIFTRV